MKKKFDKAIERIKILLEENVKLIEKNMRLEQNISSYFNLMSLSFVK